MNTHNLREYVIVYWFIKNRIMLYFQLQIWDTAGQERFRTITQSYYRSANGVILAYDITQHDTFAALPRWYDDVRKYAGDDALILLIG